MNLIEVMMIKAINIQYMIMKNNSYHLVATGFKGINFNSEFLNFVLKKTMLLSERMDHSTAAT